MNKLKRFFILFLITVILSSSAISRYESSKNMVYAMELEMSADLTMMLYNLALTALASYGIYDAANYLDYNTFLQNYSEYCSTGGFKNNYVDTNESRNKLSYYVYKTTGKIIDWQSYDEDLNEVKGGIGEWVDNSVSRTNELMAKVGATIQVKLGGGGQPPSWNNKDKKDLGTLFRGAVVAVALGYGMNQIGGNVNSMISDAGYEAYSDDWYMDDSRFYTDSNNQITYYQKFSDHSSPRTISNCPADMNLISVTSPYYSNGSFIGSNNTYTYIVGLSNVNKPIINIFGSSSSCDFCLNNGLYVYLIQGDSSNDFNVPNFSTTSNLKQFLEDYSLRNNVTNYDDWASQQSKLNNSLINTIRGMNMKLQDLSDMLKDIVGQLPNITPTNPLPAVVDPIIDDWHRVINDPNYSPDPIDDPDPEPDPDDPAPIPIEDSTWENINLKDMTTLFPFCIPFDVLAGLKLLKATPKDPIWEVPIKIDYANTTLIDYTLVIDLTAYDFDRIWNVLRTTEVLCFCIGLGLVTKKFIY